MTHKFRAAHATAPSPLELGRLLFTDKQNRVLVCPFKVEARRVLEKLQTPHVNVQAGCLDFDQLVDRVLLCDVVLQHLEVYKLDALELVLHATETEELEHLSLQVH